MSSISSCERRGWWALIEVLKQNNWIRTRLACGDHRQGSDMDVVIGRLSETVSDERGTFHSIVMARERDDGSWEGWLEFEAPDDESRRYATPIETRQHDRLTMERWASGLTGVYADGALARARTLGTVPNPVSDQLRALQELIEALDRRVPHIERAGEAKIADEARRLRAAANERIALLRDRTAQKG